MKTIWKYELDTPGLFGLAMPAGAEILTVQLQEDVPAYGRLLTHPVKKR